MGKEKIKLRNKREIGITLVALVITIIVLIILAGVSINAVMNDGLITNAKNARDDYEVAKRKEEIALIDLEVQTDFLNNGTTYNFNNGYLTGVIMYDDNPVKAVKAESVSELKQKLPNNYSILNADGSEIEDTTISVATGMIIKKGEKQLGRVIVFGDTNTHTIDAEGAIIEYYYMGDGEITMSDSTLLSWVLYRWAKCEDYEIIAMDVNHDNVINQDDETFIDTNVYQSGEKVEQNLPAPSFDELEIEYLQ